MAHHDALTKLPNRNLFMDRLRLSLAHARRYSTMVAILFIDLNRFKNINDTENGQNVSHLAQKILLSLEQPLEVEGRELFITTSIGISLFPNDATEAGALLKYADIAMYKAKESGKNNH